MRKLHFHLNLTRITGALYKEVSTFVRISRWILLRKRNVSDNIVEKIKTHFSCSNFFRKSFFLWDKVKSYCTARQATDDNIIRRMHFACWINKATGTHSKYVKLIACPRQQWLLERASMLRNNVLLYYILSIHVKSLYSDIDRYNKLIVSLFV